MLESPARPVDVSAMQRAVLDHIADVRPIDDSDAACLNEIREVLEKHNALQRFGVSLLHRHFEVAEDEFMLETTDEVKREHWVRPVKRAVFEEDGVTAQSTIVSSMRTGTSSTAAATRGVPATTTSNLARLLVPAIPTPG